jgi:hypothetical protein
MAELLANVLFATAALILVLSPVAALALANSAETLGIFEAFEHQSRDLAALAAFGVGLMGAGLVAGVGGILKALVSQRAAARDPRCDRERKC